MTDPTTPLSPIGDSLAEYRAERAGAMTVPSATSRRTWNTKRTRVVPTREEFIALIDRATVPESEWHDRDSAGAQRQLGEGRALLLSGCEYTVEPGNEHNCWWLDITYRGFNYFEIGEMSTDTLYLPTAERLAEANGKDWY